MFRICFVKERFPTKPDACTAAIKATPHRLGEAVITAKAYKQTVSDTKVFLKGIQKECSYRTLKSHFEALGPIQVRSHV